MGAKTSILIIDDDPGITETLNDILDELGYDADVAGDGFTAIEKSKKRTYDIALIDIRMPGIDGVTTLRALKKISPLMVGVMMTAYSLEGVREKALKEGAVDILQKPFGIDELIGLIKKIQNSMMRLHNETT